MRSKAETNIDTLLDEFVRLEKLAFEIWYSINDYIPSTRSSDTLIEEFKNTHTSIFFDKLKIENENISYRLLDKAELLIYAAICAAAEGLNYHVFADWNRGIHWFDMLKKVCSRFVVEIEWINVDNKLDAARKRFKESL